MLIKEVNLVIISCLIRCLLSHVECVSVLCVNMRFILLHTTLETPHFSLSLIIKKIKEGTFILQQVKLLSFSFKY